MKRRRKLGMRNEELEPHIPIVAVTASSFEEERAQIRAAGCDALICKPFREAEIFETIATYLDVEYVYAEDYEDADSHVAVHDALTPDALAALPVDLPAQLCQAIEQLDDERIHRVLAEIRNVQPAVADALTVLVQRFDYDTISAWIQQRHDRK